MLLKIRTYKEIGKLHKNIQLLMLRQMIRLLIIINRSNKKDTEKEDIDPLNYILHIIMNV